MPVTEFNISRQKVCCLFDTSFSKLIDFVPAGKIIIVTDDNINKSYSSLFSSFRIIVIPSGENRKNSATAEMIINTLIEMEADKGTVLVGVGGGVVTDLTGYVASVYKRGIRLALVPTSILAMVDAALGGKNGVNAGVLKNMIGTIYQPEYILFDYDFLKTLPQVEWESGFAEIIKHACIRDKVMFGTLEKFNLHDFQYDLSLLSSLIEENVRIKMDIVRQDEQDHDLRLLLNFGHTIGHAIENLHGLPHGHAISIGMTAACQLSEKSGYLSYDDARRVIKLLDRYHLPVDLETDTVRVFEILKMDKKRDQSNMHFIMLQGIGKGRVVSVDLKFLEEKMEEIL